MSKKDNILESFLKLSYCKKKIECLLTADTSYLLPSLLDKMEILTVKEDHVDSNNYHILKCVHSIIKKDNIVINVKRELQVKKLSDIEIHIYKFGRNNILKDISKEEHIDIIKNIYRNNKGIAMIFTRTNITLEDLKKIKIYR